MPENTPVTLRQDSSPIKKKRDYPKQRKPATIRRQRGHTSCEGCRQRKMKCSRTSPCSSCVCRGETCEWKDAQPISEGNTTLTLESSEAEVKRLRLLVSLLFEKLKEAQAGPNFQPSFAGQEAVRLYNTSPFTNPELQGGGAGPSSGIPSNHHPSYAEDMDGSGSEIEVEEEMSYREDGEEIRDADGSPREQMSDSYPVASSSKGAPHPAEAFNYSMA